MITQPDATFNREYLSDNEWKQFQDNLAIAKSICNELAIKYSIKLFIDSRWPATGLKISSFFKTQYIRITLNNNYLNDKKIFYELRCHTVIRIPFIYNKITDNNLIDVLTLDQVGDRELIYNFMEKVLGKG